MKKKYLIPALMRADQILKILATSPNEYRMIDLSEELGINKSSMFNLLTTLEQLGWIRKEKGGVYSLGTALANFGASYLSSFNLLQAFYEEGAKTQKVISENMQMGIFDSGYVVYTGKMRGDSMFQLVTEPGTRFPAYASAIGKILLSQFNQEELKEFYPKEPLAQKTEYTVSSIDELYEHLLLAQENGYAEEHEESADDMNCVAAPVFNQKNEMVAGVSIVMSNNNWAKKKDVAREEIVQLAKRLSIQSGHSFLQS